MVLDGAPCSTELQ